MAADKGKADGSGVPGHGADGAEVAEDSTQVVEYAAAIDVAKGSGMVCTRVPGSRADRRRQKTWPVKATFNEVTALMDHLRAEGIQRLVLESTSDYWRLGYAVNRSSAGQRHIRNSYADGALPGCGQHERPSTAALRSA